MMRWRWLGVAAALALAACANAPERPTAGKATLFGRVHLVPREGVTPGTPGGAYGSRRLRDVTFVDYAHPGFAVVYLQGAPSPGGAARMAITQGFGGAEFTPAHAAIGAGGELTIANESAVPHVLSCPTLQVLRRLAPGESMAIHAPAAGAHDFFLLDLPAPRAIAFVAPGPFAVISESGRYSLKNIPPGRASAVAWHPRFPQAERQVETRPGQALEVDFELRVDTRDSSRPEVAPGGRADLSNGTADASP
jgi:hypothetical protein